MYTENLPTLRIHKLSQEQYDREFSAGSVKDGEIYLTPDHDEADYVIAQSMSDSREYRKWNSGLAECWVSSEGMLIADVTTSPVDGFQYGRIGVALPFTFNTVSCIFAKVRLTGGIGYGDNFAIFDNCTYGTSNTIVYFHYKTADENPHAVAEVYVVGTWK